MPITPKPLRYYGFHCDYGRSPSSSFAPEILAFGIYTLKEPASAGLLGSFRYRFKGCPSVLKPLVKVSCDMLGFSSDMAT